MGSYSWLNSKSRHPAKRNHPRGGALQTPLNKGSLDRPPVALVLLLSAPRSLDASTLAQTVGQTFGVEVASGEVGGPAFVAGASPYFLLRLRGRVFAVHNVACPYFDNSAAVAAEMAEMVLRKAVAQHRAWVSVELLHTDAGIIENPYRMIGLLSAALTGSDCLAVWIPSRQRLYPFDSTIPDKLRSLDTLGICGSRKLCRFSAWPRTIRACSPPSAKRVVVGRSSWRRSNSATPGKSFPPRSRFGRKGGRNICGSRFRPWKTA